VFFFYCYYFPLVLLFVELNVWCEYKNEIISKFFSFDLLFVLNNNWTGVEKLHKKLRKQVFIDLNRGL